MVTSWRLRCLELASDGRQCCLAFGHLIEHDFGPEKGAARKTGPDGDRTVPVSKLRAYTPMLKTACRGERCPCANTEVSQCLYDEWKRLVE